MLDRIRQTKRDKKNYKQVEIDSYLLQVPLQNRKVGVNNAAPILLRNTSPDVPLKLDGRLHNKLKNYATALNNKNNNANAPTTNNDNKSNAKRNYIFYSNYSN